MGGGRVGVVWAELGKNIFASVIIFDLISLIVYPIPLTLLHCTGNSRPVKVSWNFCFRFGIFSLFPCFI